MLSKTLIPCYFRHGWGSCVPGTESQAPWAVLVVMATVSWTTDSSTDWPVLSRNPWRFQCPSHPRNSRWRRPAVSVAWIVSSVVKWMTRELHFFVVVVAVAFKVEWRSLLPHLCFLPRISEIENLRTHQVINIQRIYFFIKHMHMLYCVGLVSTLFHGQCCVCW